MFVAFSGEEKGLLGSYGYVQSLSKDERAAVRAYVNHDGLGLGPAAIWLSRADKMLANSFANLADIMKIPVLAVNADRVAQDDAFPFGDARIPTLSVHSITPQNMRILHSVNDKLDAINREDYWRTYILLCAWLTWLDSAPERNPA